MWVFKPLRLLVIVWHDLRFKLCSCFLRSVSLISSGTATSKIGNWRKWSLIIIYIKYSYTMAQHQFHLCSAFQLPFFVCTFSFTLFHGVFSTCQPWSFCKLYKYRCNRPFLNSEKQTQRQRTTMFYTTK